MLVSCFGSFALLDFSMDFSSIKKKKMEMLMQRAYATSEQDVWMTLSRGSHDDRSDSSVLECSNGGPAI